MFVTVLYGVLHGKTREFHYGRAGHELPVLCNEQGLTSSPDCGRGQALGILTDPAIDEQIVKLSPGDTLLLFTDGVTDAFNEIGVSFGLERLRESLGATCNDPAQLLCDRLTDLIMKYQHPIPQHDDITIVAIRSSL
jgi:sigma-B regulation protein RsbU (phosphoserine phosphatase)